jgi:hypothetical protein
MKLAFYKAKGNLIDRLIRWRTKSIYSHVEIIFEAAGWDLWFSSSPREGGARFKRVKADATHWDYLDLGSGETLAFERARTLKNKRYDYLGAILGVGLKTKIENPRRYFCCEAVAFALEGVIKLTSVSSPGELYLEAKAAIEKLDDFSLPSKTQNNFCECRSCQ